MSNPANPPADPLADEIDLRQYVEIFLRRWPWIVVPTLVLALVAAAFSFLVLAPIYQATTLVAITPPRYLMQFSPEFRTIEQERIQTLIYGSLPELARSDELVQQVLGAVDGALEGADLTLSTLQGRMQVEDSKDLGLIYLRVQDGSPRRAAQIANAWANLYVGTLNQLYGNQATEYDFFVEQLGLAADDYLTVQEALAEFKGRDPSALLSSKLSAQTRALDDYLAQQYLIAEQVQQIDGWLQELSARPPASTVSQADALASLLMQLQALGVVPDEGQFQISLEQIAAERSVADEIAFLNGLRGLLETRLAASDAQVAAVEPVVLQLQKELREAENEQARLFQALKLAESLQESLALKAEEARIATESQAGVARLASRAAVPENPIGPRKLFNTGLGAGVGFALGLALVVLLELFRSPQPAGPKDGSGDGQ